MELTGTIIAVLPATSGVSARTGNPWMSQDYVIEIPGQYPKKCVFRIFGEDRIKQFNIRQNDDVTVSFDIDAHEYNGRWFNEIRAYNVVRITSAPAPVAQQAQSPPPQPQPPVQQQQAPQQQTSGDDDLPF